MGLLNTLLTDGGTRRHRWWQLLAAVLRNPFQLRLLLPHRWSEKVIILLVMQTLNNSITVLRKRGRLGFTRLTSEQGEGEPNPTWIPVANEAARRLADELGGQAGGSWGDLMNIPMTAHFIGGCAIGDSPETGVVDPYQRLFGYPGLHVVDGSTLSANLGVNPSLTITAQAERAMALWPNAGEPDLRPPLGAQYARLAPITPCKPSVSKNALGALRYGPVHLGLPETRTG
jgi:cholesterol oxidase